MIPGIAAQRWYHDRAFSLGRAVNSGAAAHGLTLEETVFLSLGLSTNTGASAAYALDASKIAPFSAVKLLVGANGSNGSTTFTDESASARTLTAGGNAQITTTSPKFGSGAILFDGTGDYITTPNVDDFDFSTGPYTIEAFICPNETDNFTIASLWHATATSFACWALFVSGGTLFWRYYTTAGVQVNLTTIWTGSIGTWTHVAISQNDFKKARLRIDGVLKSNNTFATFPRYTSSAVFNLGKSEGASTIDLNGKLDEVRITKGFDLYDTDSDITVPTAAFPRS